MSVIGTRVNTFLSSEENQYNCYFLWAVVSGQRSAVSFKALWWEPAATIVTRELTEMAINTQMISG